MFNKKCKLCGKNLPNNYTYKECEACRNKNIDKLKKHAKIGSGVIVPLLIFVVGKFLPKK